jgi:Tc toxin complex TcA C-terminal TcB-binding domain
VTDTSVILTGIGTVAPPTNFGVPGGYFYALAAMMPWQVNAQGRYGRATSDQLANILSGLTSAINIGTISDAEAFVTAAPAGINAAQVARRLVAPNVASGSSTALAPLDSFVLRTTGITPSGKTLTFASSVAAVQSTMSVSGQSIVAGSSIASIDTNANSVTLGPSVLNAVVAGSSVIFTPQYPSGLQQLIQAWLAFPPSVSGSISSETYQPTDDDAKFWPAASAAQPAAFLNPVLCALTQGFMLPPPFSVALGDKIISDLLPSPSVAALSAVTAQQWSDFLTKQPTWLPTQKGTTSSRIATFVQQVQKFFAVDSGGPPSMFVLATVNPTASGTVLQFASPAGVLVGMSVSGTNIPAGATVVHVDSTTSATVTSVTLDASHAVTGSGVAKAANITFSLSTAAGAAASPPTLQGPSKDWLSACVTAYQALVGPGTFVFGKFTAHQLYLFQQKEAAALHRRIYDLALHASRQAEHAFNLERGHTTRRFLPACGWDNLHEGLTAGERLSVALRHMVTRDSTCAVSVAWRSRYPA